MPTKLWDRQTDYMVVVSVVVSRLPVARPHPASGGAAMTDLIERLRAERDEARAEVGFTKRDNESKQLA